MNADRWSIPTPVLDAKGRSSNATTQVDVDAARFRRSGWRHLVTDHFHHPAWEESVSIPELRVVFRESRDGGVAADTGAVDQLLEHLHKALGDTLAHPRFVETQERGYVLLPTDLGRVRSVFERGAIETREGLLAVADSGLILVVSNGRLATAYFADGTEHMRGKDRFKEAAALVRRRANLSGYHDGKLGRYWRRVTPTTFHDVKTWARPMLRARES